MVKKIVLDLVELVDWAESTDDVFLDCFIFLNDSEVHKNRYVGRFRYADPWPGYRNEREFYRACIKKY